VGVAVGPDFYTPNCHKWLMAPKGGAFLHGRKEHQHLARPAAVSHGQPWVSSYAAPAKIEGLGGIAVSEDGQDVAGAYGTYISYR
jgi:isopenicillin-N epimerase